MKFQTSHVFFVIKKGIIADFEDTHRTDYGVGYTQTFYEFKPVLKDASPEKILQFFHNVEKIYSIETSDKKCKFTNVHKTPMSLERVHQTIQCNVVMQRSLYNMHGFV